MLSQFRLLVSLSHLVGVGGRRLEAVALVLHDGGGGVLADLGLIWIGFPFEMMTTGIGEREGVLAIRDSHARCGDASDG